MGFNFLRGRVWPGRCLRLPGVQFVQPVFHMAQRLEQGQPGLAQVESGIQGILKFLALIDPRQLLGFRRELRRSSRTGSSAVPQLKLREHALELRVGNLLLEAGDLGLRIELADVACERRNLHIVLTLGFLGLNL